jgi:ketopantoate reductase
MIVIGAGRIGTGLQANAEARGLAISLVERASGWEALDRPAGEPVMVAVRNEHLSEVLARVPAHRRVDLVFVQNGAVRDELAHRKMAEATRGILYVLAARRHAPPIPGGINVFSGPRAEATAAWLGTAGLPSEAVDRPAFAEFEFEKLLWLATNGPLCQEHAVPVGIVATEHRDALDALVRELAPIGRATWGVQADPDRLIERIVAYSLAIPDYAASVKEWPWRNGWLRQQARTHRIPTPLHDRLLAQIGHPG